MPDPVRVDDSRRAADHAPCRFAICIPNYNYGSYVGATIESVLLQGEDLFRVYVSDNASTDDSVQVIGGFDADLVRVRANPQNLGFAANLDKAVDVSEDEPWIIMLSSDDLMRPGALATYDQLIDLLGSDDDIVITGSTNVVDADGAEVGTRHPPGWLWRTEDIDAEMSSKVGAPVYRQKAEQALERSLRLMRNPTYFVSTAYPRELYRRAGGYRGNRLINPDKGFHWRLLAEARELVYIDQSLFSYRVHDQNQNALQQRAGSLKHLVDEYCYTFELDDSVLERAGLTRDDLVHAFVEHDIVLRGFNALARGDRRLARRSVTFGQAVYPRQVNASTKAWMLRTLVRTGELGTAVSRAVRDVARRRALGAPQARLHDD